MKGILSSVKKFFRKEEKKVEEFVEYEETLIAKWGYAVLRKIMAPFVRLFWIAEVEGLHNIPKDGAVIVASNHESYFDFLCFASISPRKIHYLAAEKFFESRLWKPLMKLTGQIRIDRKHPDKTKVFQQVFSALNQGRMIGIFPEGTRSPDGKLLKAFTGVGRIALKSKTPIVPVGMIGTYEIMSRHDKYPKLKKAKIKIGEPLHFKEFHDIEHDHIHYKTVTDKVMLKIAELTGEEYPHIDEYKEEIEFK